MWPPPAIAVRYDLCQQQGDELDEFAKLNGAFITVRLHSCELMPKPATQTVRPMNRDRRAAHFFAHNVSGAGRRKTGSPSTILHVDEISKTPVEQALISFGAHERLRGGYDDPQNSWNVKNGCLIEFE